MFARSLILIVGLLACADPVDDPANDGLVDDPDPAFECTSFGTELDDCATDFTLQSADGDSVSLSQLAGERVVLLGVAEW